MALTRAFLANGNTVIAGCRRPSESSDLKLLSLLHPEAKDVVKCDLNSENEHD